MDARRRFRGSWYRCFLAVWAAGAVGRASAIDPPNLPLRISPKFSTMTGFSDAKQTISGTLAIRLSYQRQTVEQSGLGDPRHVVLVTKFASGTTGHVFMAELQNPDTNIVYTGVNLVGDFKQSLDMKCYPFDRQTVTFDITMQHPGDLSLFFVLECDYPSPRYTVNASDDTVLSCSHPVDKTSLGFEWGNFACEKVNDELITCALVGDRETRFKFLTFVFPAVLFILVSFMSFHMRPELAMPRVGTTMIALLNINLLKDTAQREMPMLGEMSWLEEFLLAGEVALFFNMAAHVASFYFNTRQAVSRWIDDASGILLPPAFFVYAFGRLSVRHCEVSNYSDVLVAVCTLFLAVAIAIVLRRHIVPAVSYRRGAGGGGKTGRQEEKCLDNHGAQKHGGKGDTLSDAPPLSGPLRHMLETATASIWAQGGSRLAEGFAKTLRAHWIVSREQFVSGELGGAECVSKATGLPLALCARLVALAREEGGAGGAGGAVGSAPAPADGVVETLGI